MSSFPVLMGGTNITLNSYLSKVNVNVILARVWTDKITLRPQRAKNITDDQHHIPTPPSIVFYGTNTNDFSFI